MNEPGVNPLGGFKTEFQREEYLNDCVSNFASRLRSALLDIDDGVTTIGCRADCDCTPFVQKRSADEAIAAWNRRASREWQGFDVVYAQCVLHRDVPWTGTLTCVARSVTTVCPICNPPAAPPSGEGT